MQFFSKSSYQVCPPAETSFAVLKILYATIFKIKFLAEKFSLFRKIHISRHNYVKNSPTGNHLAPARDSEWVFEIIVIFTQPTRRINCITKMPEITPTRRTA